MHENLCNRESKGRGGKDHHRRQSGLCAGYQLRPAGAAGGRRWQANATQILLPPGEYAGLGALLRGYAICYDELAIHTDVPGLDVLPAAEDLWALDLEAAGGNRGRCYRAVRDMREAMEEDNAYDVMIIDCPPTCPPPVCRPSWPAMPSSSPCCPTPARSPGWVIWWIRSPACAPSIRNCGWPGFWSISGTAAGGGGFGGLPPGGGPCAGLRYRDPPHRQGAGELLGRMPYRHGALSARRPGTTVPGWRSCWTRRVSSMAKPDLGALIAQDHGPPSEERDIETITGRSWTPNGPEGEAILTHRPVPDRGKGHALPWGVAALAQ